MEYQNYKKKLMIALSRCISLALLCFMIVILGLGCSPADRKNAVDKYKEGLSLYQQGRYQEAVEAYREVIRIKPEDALAYNDLGASYAALGRHAEAVECYKEAIRIKPDAAGAYFNLGMAYGELERWEEAVEAYKESVRFNPKDVDAQFNLGLSYWTIDDKNSALEVLKVLRGFDQEKAEKLSAIINQESIKEVNEEAAVTCKVEGISADNGQSNIFVSCNGVMRSIRVGDFVCEGKVVKVYAPREADGITDQTVAQYEYRIKVQFGQDERVFKNGDIICGDPNSISMPKMDFARIYESNNAEEMRLKENIRKADEYYARAQTLLRQRVLSVKSYEKIINLYGQAIQEITFALNKTNAVGEKFLKEYLSRYKEENRQLTEHMYDLKDKIRIAKLDKKIVIGMTEADVIESIGKPYEINRDNYAGDIHEQWVYGVAITSRNYLYFEDGILTSWQK